MTDILNIKITKWREALKDHHTGPLIIAKEVVDVIDNWSAYKADADGLSPSEFLRKHLTYDARWFRNRAYAVDKLGEASRRALSHAAAVYLATAVPEDQLEAVKKAVYESRRHGQPVKYHTARAIVRRMLGRGIVRAHRCRQCAIYLAEIDRLRAGLE